MPLLVFVISFCPSTDIIPDNALAAATATSGGSARFFPQSPTAEAETYTRSTAVDIDLNDAQTKELLLEVVAIIKSTPGDLQRTLEESLLKLNEDKKKYVTLQSLEWSGYRSVSWTDCSNR
jgi:hypothetical protein